MSIFFKNMMIFKIADSFQIDLDTLKERLQSHPFSPCGQQQQVTYGWVGPVSDGNLVHDSGDNWLICMKKQERVLPNPVIRKALTDKVEEIRINEDRRVGSKERQTLKDELIFSMLPKAFPKDSLHYAYINLKLGFIVVDASSESMADTMQSFLRECLGSLPCTLFQSHCQPASLLTSWMEGCPADDSWQLLPDVEFINAQNSDIKIKLKNLELDEDVIQTHIDQGARVSQVAFNWNERLTAVINAKAQVKRIRFSDVLTEQSLEESGDDRESQFDASFRIMAGELNKLIGEMITHFGISE